MVKQPDKRPRSAAKPQKTRASSRRPVESPKAVASLVDAIPPEVHAENKQRPAAPIAALAPEPVTQPPEPTPEPTKPQPAQSEPPKTAPQQKTKSGLGFLALVLGGVVAGATGFAVANYTTLAVENGFESQIAAQGARISELQQQLEGQSDVDLTSIETAQAELAAQLADLNDELTATSADFADRIAALERQPQGDGEVFMPSISAYEAEMAALRAELSELTDIARTELDAARTEAAAIEENAAAAARNAAGRAAVARLQAGLESGAPLGAALGDLEQILDGPAPDALLAVQDGVPTLAALQDSFPAYARAALNTARAEGVAGEETSRVGAFLRNQFDVRSVTPRDGDDADAILSRAQAALRNGRLNDTLVEISNLPEVARAEMSDWLALAEARADAVMAIDTLATSMRDN